MAAIRRQASENYGGAGSGGGVTPVLAVAAVSFIVGLPVGWFGYPMLTDRTAETSDDHRQILALYEIWRAEWKDRRVNPDAEQYIRKDQFVCYGVNQEGEPEVSSWAETVELGQAFMRDADEIVPLSDPPHVQIQGPAAMVRFQPARCRIGDSWVAGDWSEVFFGDESTL